MTMFASLWNVNMIQVNRLTELLLALFEAGHARVTTRVSTLPGHKCYHAAPRRKKMAYLELLLAKPLEKKEPNIRKL